MKQNRKKKINASKYRIPSEVRVRAVVMLRNHKRTSKFDPIFLPKSCEIIDRSVNGRFLTVERKRDWKIFKTNPDDIKIFNGSTDTVVGRNTTVMPEEAKSMIWHKQFEQCKPNLDDNYEWNNQHVAYTQEGNVFSQELSREEVSQGDTKIFLLFLVGHRG